MIEELRSERRERIRRFALVCIELFKTSYDPSEAKQSLTAELQGWDNGYVQSVQRDTERIA
ncbi:MAG TPA: hypothetical protein VGN34_23440 [Ktedonobacteraceae bacterium]